jgi:membrane associated rhomboid family serine protease
MDIFGFIDQFTQTITQMKAQAPLAFSIVLILWGIHLINAATNYKLNYLGIVPRRFFGLLGIISSPFLHGNFGHLLFNSIPLFFLADFLLVGGLNEFYCITVIIMLMSGLAVWLFARRAVHIGASGVIMGYFGCLLTTAVQRPTGATVLLAAVTLYYFSGLLMSLFPTDVKSSWEGHIFGFLAGIAAVFLCPMVMTAL